MPVPHQPPNNIPLASSLPKVSFRKIPVDEIHQLLAPAGVKDQQHINFGFNDGSEFEKPEHYLRYVEPIDSELNKQVEYDMDEQDQEWLDALNVERRRDQHDIISYEVFEIIIDRLEKEWFDLMKRVPVKAIPLAIGDDGEPIADGSEDIECAICDDGECENSNAIVFCDGCNLAVHQDCYGIPYIPEGQWLCRKCTVSPDRAVSCVLCPHEGGAFKQTTQGKWAHLLCAMWIPETGVSNPVYMEPIDSVERVPKARWKLQCYLCNRKMGACIQCDNKNCFTAFHVTCARKNGLLLKSQRQRVTHSHDSNSDDDDSSDLLRAWCHKHVPKAVRAQKLRLHGMDENELFQDASSQFRTVSPPNIKKGSSQLAVVTAPGRKKSARAYKKSYRAGPTLVPAFVINRVLEHISRIHVRKKPQLTMQIAKFWSLKREARRGAPLLKRLHLEPWTATAGNKEQSDAERIKKLQFLLRLREDLEKVRMLAELVRKREKEKLRQAQIIRSAMIDGILYPYNDILRRFLERVSALDRTSLFLEPVSPQKVPDYYEIIKTPMDWTTISNKILDYHYTTLSEFKEDINLVLDNAMLYNKIDTHYHRTAARIRKVAQPIFEELDRLSHVHGNDAELQLEAEDNIIELLRDYTEEEMIPSMDGSSNVIEELTRCFYVEEISERVEKGEQNGTIRMNAQSKKAADRAARSERSRLAAQRRKEAKEAEGDDADITMASVVEGDESIRSTRSVKRHSTLNASIASLEARKRKREEQDVSKSEYARGLQVDISDEEDEEASDDANLEVKQVSNHDSFKKFNTGWVLPEGSKRARSSGIPSSESGGIRLLSSQTNSSQRKAKREVSSDLSEPEEFPKSSSHHRTRSGETNEDRKRQRVTSVSIEAESGTPIRTKTGQFARRSMKSYKISKLQPPTRARHSFAGETKQEEFNRRRREARRNAKLKGEYAPSTLCWAKVEGHAAHPAEIFDEESKEVPKKVLEEKNKLKRSNNESIHLVRFFGDTATFGWIVTSKLKFMLEDDEMDQRMLKAPKSGRERNIIRQSYEEAKAQLEA